MHGPWPPVLSRSELCAALGISSSLVAPPPYLGNMIREGYPPGFVGIEGSSAGNDPAGEEDEEEELRFICGGEEMDVSDDELDGDKAAVAAEKECGQARKAVMTVVFPGDAPSGT